jgi:hypothetical protein
MPYPLIDDKPIFVRPAHYPSSRVADPSHFAGDNPQSSDF